MYVGTIAYIIRGGEEGGEGEGEEREREAEATTISEITEDRKKIRKKQGRLEKEAAKTNKGEGRGKATPTWRRIMSVYENRASKSSSMTPMFADTSVPLADKMFTRISAANGSNIWACAARKKTQKPKTNERNIK